MVAWAQELGSEWIVGVCVCVSSVGNGGGGVEQS